MTTDSTKNKKYAWKGHYSLPISRKVEDDLKVFWGNTAYDAESFILICADRAIKLSFSFSERSNTFYCTIAPRDPNHAHYGYTFGYGHTDITTLGKIMWWVVVTWYDNDHEMGRPVNLELDI